MTKRKKQHRGSPESQRPRRERVADDERIAGPPLRPTPEHRAAVRSQHRAQNANRSGLTYALIPAVVVVALGVAGLWYVSGDRGSSNTAARPSESQTASLLANVVWPSYVARGPGAVKEAYEFAVTRPEVLQYMPCYCGCGQHNGHDSNKACFIQNMNQGGSTIVFDNHGST